MFRPERYEAENLYNKLNINDLQHLYPSPDIRSVRVRKLRRITWAKYVTRTGKMRKA
jgi:hypothetical protein